MNLHHKLRSLEAKYEKMLASGNPNLTTLRKTREQIIKLKFDLGLN